MMKLPVLIVDDDRNLLEALCTTLRLAGHTALAAGDCEAALALLQKQQVGLVVSDVQMKPMDGLQLLQKIKALDPALPVLLMTAYGEIGKAVAAMRAGACDYLLKPFEPAVLSAQVERYLLPATDHGAAGVMMAMGGGVRGGIYGTAPNLNTDPANPTLENNTADVKYETDFRAVYAKILDSWLGANSVTILGGDYRGGAPAIL